MCKYIIFCTYILSRCTHVHCSDFCDLMIMRTFILDPLHLEEAKNSNMLDFTLSLKMMLGFQ